MTDRIDRRTLIKKGVAGLGAALVGAGSAAPPGSLGRRARWSGARPAGGPPVHR